MTANLVWESSASTGSSDLALVAIARRFSDAYGTGGSDVFPYAIINRDAVEWEYGTGHLSDTDILVRDTVILSSNSNNLVNFSAGVKDITAFIPVDSIVQTTIAQTLTNKTLVSPLIDTSLELGHATDTTLSRLAAGVLAVEDIPVAGIRMFAATATTSGTTVQRTGIPSWARRVCMLFNNVRSSNTDNFRIRAGTSAGLAASGYNAGGMRTTASGTENSGSTQEFPVLRTNSAQQVSGIFMLSAIDLANGIWAGSGTFGGDDGIASWVTGGVVDLPGPLDRVGINIASSAFNGGSFTVTYE